MIGKRIAWIDWARAIAIIMVIICHSTESVYSMTLNGITTTGIGSQISALSLFTIGRLGVPLFLFMSGYLMLDRYYDRQACLKFWKTKWVGLLIATESWIVIYNLFICLMNAVPLDLFQLAKQMLFLEKIPGMGHMWYMPMIIGLYLFLPFISNGLKWLDDAKLLIFPLCIACSILFITPVASIVSQSLGGNELNCAIAPGFSGSYYGCYMFFGYCTKKATHLPQKSVVFSIGLIAFLATVYLQIFAYNRGVYAPAWYSNGLLMAAGLNLFVFLAQAKSLKETKWISIISYYSFALYLVHYPIKILIAPLVTSAGIPTHALQVIVLSLCVLAISLVVCWAIARIPKVGEKLLYLR